MGVWGNIRKTTVLTDLSDRETAFEEKWKCGKLAVTTVEGKVNKTTCHQILGLLNGFRLETTNPRGPLHIRRKRLLHPASDCGSVGGRTG